MQGILGDPGLPGRDGDPGIEVSSALELKIHLQFGTKIVNISICLQAYQGPQGPSGKHGQSGAKVHFKHWKKCAVEFFWQFHLLPLVFYRGKKVPRGQQEKWAPKVEL